MKKTFIRLLLTTIFFWSVSFAQPKNDSVAVTIPVDTVKKAKQNLFVNRAFFDSNYIVNRILIGTSVAFYDLNSGTTQGKAAPKYVYTEFNFYYPNCFKFSRNKEKEARWGFYSGASRSKSLEVDSLPIRTLTFTPIPLTLDSTGYLRKVGTAVQQVTNNTIRLNGCVLFPICFPNIKNLTIKFKDSTNYFSNNLLSPDNNKTRIHFIPSSQFSIQVINKEYKFYNIETIKTDTVSVPSRVNYEENLTNFRENYIMTNWGLGVFTTLVTEEIDLRLIPHVGIAFISNNAAIKNNWLLDNQNGTTQDTGISWRSYADIQFVVMERNLGITIGGNYNATLTLNNGKDNILRSYSINFYIAKTLDFSKIGDIVKI